MRTNHVAFADEGRAGQPEVCRAGTPISISAPVSGDYRVYMTINSAHGTGVLRNGMVIAVPVRSPRPPSAIRREIIPGGGAREGLRSGCGRESCGRSRASTARVPERRAGGTRGAVP